MRAALLFGPREMRVVDIEVPEPGPDQVLVRVARYAPYGTDLDIYKADDLRHTLPYPVGIGADFAGTIEKVGAHVLTFAPGDRISALTLPHCGHCEQCRIGYTNRCVNTADTNLMRQVCCQELTLVPANKLAHLPDSVGFDDAAMLASLVTALNGFEMMRPQPGEVICVIGTGGMGWGGVAVARLYGCRVIAVGMGPVRARLAGKLGDGVTVIEQKSHSDDVTEQVRRLVPRGVDVIYETTVSTWGFEQAFRITAPGARIGHIGGPAIPVTGWAMVDREVTLIGVRAGHQQDQALRLVEAGLVDLKPTITHRVGLEDAPDVFAMLIGEERRNVGRVMIEMDREGA